MALNIYEINKIASNSLQTHLVHNSNWTK